MKILFVCSGNTCRSPMAEGIFRKMVKEKGWEDRVLCQSAGLAPAEGEPASENAVAVCREIGVDISSHTARRLTGEELPQWDIFFVMTATHAYILERAGALAAKIYVPEEIGDPYGHDLETYRACRDKLTAELGKFVRSCVAPFLALEQEE